MMITRGVVTYDKDTKRKQFTTPPRNLIYQVRGVVTYDKDTKRKQFTTENTSFHEKRERLAPIPAETMNKSAIRRT